MLRTLFALSFFALFSTSCLDKDSFSEIPEIRYLDMIQVDRSLEVRFAFTDGDGDIGLKPDEDYFPFGPCDEYYKNLIIDPYRKVNGEYVLARLVVPSECSPDTVTTWDTVGYDQRIKYLVPETKDKTLEGEIKVTLNEVLEEFPGDTIKFKLTLIDRALHKSNVIETDAIINN